MDFIFDRIFSIGFKSGLYGGKYIQEIPALSKSSVTILASRPLSGQHPIGELSSFFNNILVLPTSLSLNIGFQYKSHSQAVTVQ